MRYRTQIGIVGAGPAGLLLSHLLSLAGIDSIVLERHSRTYVEGRIRAGVLEQDCVDLLRHTGLGDRLDREALRHDGIRLSFGGAHHRIDFSELTPGRSVTVYGQHEVVKDIIAKRLADGGDLRFEAGVDAILDPLGANPVLAVSAESGSYEIDCDFVIGCDGFHGPSRETIPAGDRREYERVYPFAWLGILAEAPPSLDELVYAHHDNGFALFSMRSPEITRLYLQCATEEDAGNWSDEEIWEELDRRFDVERTGWRPARGEIIQKGVTPLRSFVSEPMRYANLFLAGDSAHIVPPTGAKGMNLAIADVLLLSRALERHYAGKGSDGLDTYSDAALRRSWKVQRFSWWMTNLLHRFDQASPYDRRVQEAELDYVTSSRSAATALAENYVGLPLD